MGNVSGTEVRVDDAGAVIHVAVATDHAYAPWCATTVLSCLRSTPGREVRVHVLHGPDLPPADQRQLAAMVDGQGARVDFHLIGPGRLSVFPSKGPELGDRVSWMRVLLPELLPELDRIIYLDADTLVVDSLDSLWTTPLRGHPLGAVANVVEPAQRHHVASLGVEDFRRYFNAGVLVMDLSALRDPPLFADAVRCVNEHGPRLSWYDQDVLNILFVNRWRPLHPRWNAQNSFWSWTPWAQEVFGGDDLRAAMATPAILHFEGPSLAKPWHYLCQHPFRGAFRDTLALTPWCGLPLDERTLATRAISRLPPQSRVPAYVRMHQIRRTLGARGPRSRP